MDQDDVSPREEEREKPSFAASLGAIFGAMLWIVPVFAVVGVLIYAVTKWLG